MAHPRSGTEGMRDGSDTIAVWPLLHGLLLCPSCSNGHACGRARKDAGRAAQAIADLQQP